MNPLQLLCVVVICITSASTALDAQSSKYRWRIKPREKLPKNSLLGISSKLFDRKEKKANEPPTRIWHDSVTERKEPAFDDSSIKKSANPPTKIFANPPKKTPTNTPTRKFVNSPTKKSANPPTKKSANPPTKKSANPPTIKAINPPTRKHERPVELQDIYLSNFEKRTQDDKDDVSMAEQACSGGRRITCLKGTVTSLGYPDALPSNATCKWTIEAPEGQVIQLDFTDISLGESDCVTLNFSGSAVDSLYDNTIQLCGELPPRKVTSVGNEIVLTLTTDGNGGGRGLLFDFLARNPVECEDVLELEGDSGTLTSVNFPQFYSPHAKCLWRIVASPDKVLTVTFSELAIEFARSCDYDSLTLYDGARSSDPPLGVYCGHDIPDVIKSTSNVIFVVLTSDSSTEDKGFELTWSAS